MWHHCCLMHLFARTTWIEASHCRCAQASAFVRLGELRVLPVAEYDGRFDRWLIDAPLSEGCGGPDLPEEVML